MREFITSGARQIAYKHIVHDPALPWVVFSNSLLTDTALWTPQVLGLGGRCNILLYDQYGHGRSPVSPLEAPLTFSDLADDLLTVIATTGAEKVTVVGVSMGVPTTLLAFARKPEVFARLVLVNGQVATPPEARAMWDERIALAQDNFTGFCNATMRRWLGADVADGPAGLALLQMMQSTPFAAFAACARALGSFDASAGLRLLSDPAYRVPVLALAGSNDTALAAHMAEVFAPVATYVPIPDAGHLPCYERPEAFNARLLAFLAES